MFAFNSPCALSSDTFLRNHWSIKSKEAIHKSEILCNLVPLTNQQTCKSFFGAFFEMKNKVLSSRGFDAARLLETFVVERFSISFLLELSPASALDVVAISLGNYLNWDGNDEQL